jgi:PAS domain S-box-containing protein
MRPATALLALAAILVIAIAGANAGILWYFRTVALDGAMREIGNLDLILAERTARSIQQVDAVLRAMSERLPATEGRLNGRRVSQQMAELVAAAPSLRSMVVAGPDGIVVARTPLEGGPFYIGDRPHFIAQRDDGGAAGLFISEPFTRRPDGKLSIGFSRRVNHADGSFAGVVASAVEPSYFNDIYAALDLHGTSTVALLRDDGACLMRFPALDAGGPSCAADPTIAAHLAAAPSGIYRDIDPRDGRERMVGYRRVIDLPLVTLVSMKTGAALREWRHQARVFSGGALAAAAILCILVFLLAKEVGRREALAAALRANEERFRNFAEASSDWFWEQDENLRFSYLSPAVLDRSGLPVADHIGKTRRDVVTRGVSAEQWRRHEADLEARRPFRDFRFQRSMPDGTLRHISISGKPIFDEAGRFCGYAGSARDVTQEIMVEQRLRETTAEAEAASRTKSEFLAVISHELRTPLNAIIGFSDVISREVLGPIGSVRYREYAGDILSAGRHLLGLINNILDMSKIEAQKMTLFEETIDIAALAASCIRIVERQAADGRIALTLDMPPALPSLRGDEMRLKQILLNLLSNAVKFTAAEGRITVAARPLDDGGLEIAVVDTGIGMNEDEVAIALQPFRQVESALARRHEGTGLGLPLVKAFIEMHGGTLALHSVPGEGTTAAIRLPAVRVVARTTLRKAAG